MATLKLDSEFFIAKLVKFIVSKAQTEPLYSGIYADMCCTLTQVVDRCVSKLQTIETDESVSNIEIGIFKILVTKECHLAFDEIFHHAGKRDDNFVLHQYRQKMFGAVQFISQLYNAEFFHNDLFLPLLYRLLK